MRDPEALREDDGPHRRGARPGAGAPGLRVNAPVFLVSAGAILVFVALTALFTEEAGALVGFLQGRIVTLGGWFYTLAVAFFLVFVVVVAVGPWGRLRLGPDDAEPEFGWTAWFAMLFSAGMGIGLLFYSVAEPVLHYLDPAGAPGRTDAAVRRAMELTFFHWGLHAWAVYIVVGLALAWFAYRRGLPLTVRSALHPVLGDRIHGPLGHAVDIFAVLGTMFGVATSLGLGVMQINAGLSWLAPVPEGVGVQLLLIGGITLLATASVVAGLDRGIRRLSELNLALGLLLVVFLFAVGPTVHLLDALAANVGAYLGGLVRNTFRTAAYGDPAWLGDWTIFYWGWWIAWSPFVGMFLARISRGRTVREFVLGVLLVPTALTFVWLTVFGNTALERIHSGAGAGLATAVQERLPTALFVLLEQFPLAPVSSLVATVVVMTFFVTSSDSGSLVIDIITAGGDPDPPVAQRVFWALAEGAVAATLLVAGGLQALQTAAIASALPFAVVMLFICWGLARSLGAEAAAGRRPPVGGESARGSPGGPVSSPGDPAP